MQSMIEMSQSKLKDVEGGHLLAAAATVVGLGSVVIDTHQGLQFGDAQIPGTGTVANKLHKKYPKAAALLSWTSGTFIALGTVLLGD